MYNFGSFDAFIVKPTIMPDFARNLHHYIEWVRYFAAKDHVVLYIRILIGCHLWLSSVRSSSVFPLRSLIFANNQYLVEYLEIKYTF